MNLEIDGLGFYTEKYGFLSSTGDRNTTGNPCTCLRQKAEGPNFLTTDSPSQHPGGDWGPILSCCLCRSSRSLPRVTPIVVIKAEWNLGVLPVLWSTDPAFIQSLDLTGCNCTRPDRDLRAVISVCTVLTGNLDVDVTLS